MNKGRIAGLIASFVLVFAGLAWIFMIAAIMTINESFISTAGSLILASIVILAGFITVAVLAMRVPDAERRV